MHNKIDLKTTGKIIDAVLLLLPVVKTVFGYNLGFLR